MLPPNVQTILFSATYKDDVRAFAERVVPEANLISLKREELSVEAIKQLYIRCDSQENKYETLCAMYGLLNVGQSIIFCHVFLSFLDCISSEWTREKMTREECTKKQKTATD